MITYARDLQNDLINLQIGIALNEEKFQAMDSLIRTLALENQTNSTRRLAYYLYRAYMGTQTEVIFSRQTILQMKSTGALGLISKVAV